MKTLRSVREEKGVKQIAVANHLGVSRQTYAGYERDQERMSIEQAQAVCRFLNCDIREIFFPEDVK